MGGIVALAVAALAMVMGVGAEAEPAGHFLYQYTGECSFTPNGSGPEGGPPVGVRYINRYIYDREEYLRFDSHRGEYEAVSPLGEPDAREWNSQKDFMEQMRAQVETFCRHNYEVRKPFALSRRVQPLVVITPAEHEPSSPSPSPNILLICDVATFWPAEIEIKWFRNGEEQTESVWTTDLTSNGDWTFQIQVMLETQPERGDLYACQVEHASFPSPVTVQWEPQSDSARSKMWTGVAGIILGLAFLVVGLIFYLKNKKGNVLPQPSVPLMD